MPKCENKVVENSGYKVYFDKTTLANGTQEATRANNQNIGGARLVPPRLLSRSPRAAVHSCH